MPRNDVPHIRVHALDRNVLCVAERRSDGWRAYCGAVPGRSHEREYPEVLRSGTKLSEMIAKAVFADIDVYVE